MLSGLKIGKAAIIGAGVMGAGIAAQFADAGLSVVLLDLDPTAASAGVARQLKTNGFADPRHADLIRTGSSIDDIGLLHDADWIVEAAAERLEIKRQIFDAVDAVRKPGSILSSNTSTMLLASLTASMRGPLAADFMITHFFNPPRWMRLLELVSGERTRPDAVAAISAFAEQRLGKVVVRCNDTPGFIANRIGNFWMAAALHETVALGLDVEEADTVLGKPFGAPTGVFALLDLVGIDLLPPAWRSLQTGLPADDAFQAFPAEPPLITRMIATGRLGRKAGAGFMRRLPAGTFEVLDLATNEYRPMRIDVPDAVASTGGDLRALMAHDSPAGELARRVWGSTLAYATSLVPEIAASKELVDQALQNGYGWRWGPFELNEQIGAS